MSRDPALQTMSVNLPSELIRRVRSLGFHHDLSGSSIVEQALVTLLGDLPEEQVAERLHAQGATLRRP